MENNSQNNGEADHPLAELSRMLIMGEGNFYINRIKTILIGVPPAKFAEFLLAADHYLFKSTVYYLRLFRTLPEIAGILNSPDFTLAALEKIVVYLHFNLQILEKPVDGIFGEQLPELSQEKYLALLLESRHVIRDHRICLNIVSRMNKESLDRFVNEKDNAIQILGEIIKQFPGETLKNFLYQNAELYGFLKLFFEYGSDSDQEVLELLEKYRDEVEEAVKIMFVAKNFSEENEYAGAPEPPRPLTPAEGDEFIETDVQVDAGRIMGIVAELKSARNIEQAIELMDEKHGFQSVAEKHIVRNILINPHFRDILDSLPEMSGDEFKFLEEGGDLGIF